MMLTEAEAKTKWCPFSRTGMLASEHCGVAVNRSVVPADDKSRAYDAYSIYAETRCLGSGCMAWQVIALSPKYLHDDDLRPVNSDAVTPRGTCGLARL